MGSDLYQNGLNGGYDAGYRVGHEEGYKTGHEEGHDEGYNTGYDFGYGKGLSDGRREGVEEALARLEDLADLEDSLRKKLVRPSFELDLKDMFNRLGYNLERKKGQ